MEPLDRFEPPRFSGIPLPSVVQKSEYYLESLLNKFNKSSFGRNGGKEQCQLAELAAQMAPHPVVATLLGTARSVTI